jgi:hypothetical protein
VLSVRRRAIASVEKAAGAYTMRDPLWVTMAQGRHPVSYRQPRHPTSAFPWSIQEGRSGCVARQTAWSVRGEDRDEGDAADRAMAKETDGGRLLFLGAELGRPSCLSITMLRLLAERAESHAGGRFGRHTQMCGLRLRRCV